MQKIWNAIKVRKPVSERDATEGLAARAEHRTRQHYSTTFDPNYYTAFLFTKGIVFHNPQAAKDHFSEFGIKEGYQPNADLALQAAIAKFGNIPLDFDPAFYLQEYTDVANVYSFKNGAEIHFLEHGRDEGRFVSLLHKLETQFGTLPVNFNEDYYLEKHEDVRNFFFGKHAGASHYLQYGRKEGRAYNRDMEFIYTEAHVNLTTNRIYDLPDVVVDSTEPTRVNVLVPAFEFKSMSAGFFGVFQVARFIKQCGFKVRLVMFDNFFWDEAEFRVKLEGYPGMEALFDELEVAYIGERLAPLRVSPRDNCVATVWYSAYFAQKIMSTTLSREPFLYLIQDYETNFYAGSSKFSFADATYSMDYAALFSSKPLQDFFVERKIGRFAETKPRHVYFNNACASRLLPESDFISHDQTSFKLAFYCRPVVDRNMFELAALTLCRAYREGVFAGGEWEFYGIGLGEATIQLANGVFLKQLPRVNLREYERLIATFDVGLCLMASPHPSLLPFDLGGSGAVVLTNTFATKQQAYFDGICSNVIAREPSLPAMVDGLREAVSRASDRSSRHRSASLMKYPRAWSATFSAEHKSFIEKTFSASKDP